MWSIEPGESPRPYVAVWPRGGGKSTGAEGAAVALGAPRLAEGRAPRRYCVYVRETQKQADDSVSNIREMLESDRLGVYYPSLGQPSLGTHGLRKGWRRQRLIAASGYVIDALGLDTAARGLKVGVLRPDLIIFDDIDARHDSQRLTRKKIEIITDSILPIGTDHCAVLVIQNRMIPNGVVRRLEDGRADFLVRRFVPAAEPALRVLKVQTVFDKDLGRNRTVIRSGRPTWKGRGLEACQRFIDRFGYKSFLRECQHEVDDVEGALWTVDVINQGRRKPLKRYKRIVIGVDPSGGAAEIGIVAVGLGYDGHAYVLKDVSVLGKPSVWGRRVSLLFHLLKADRVIAEKNFGGDMVESTLRVVDRRLPVTVVQTARGKLVRAEPISALYADGLVHHVGVFDEMEIEMTTWTPDSSESPNRMDALVWALTELMRAMVYDEVEAASF